LLVHPYSRPFERAGLGGRGKALAHDLAPGHYHVGSRETARSKHLSKRWRDKIAELAAHHLGLANACLRQGDLL
jgi:hypothetical protein